MFGKKKKKKIKAPMNCEKCEYIKWCLEMMYSQQDIICIKELEEERRRI